MQKKSLLVALFCGALCLTGCLKNEESASVAQVRIAKANELNSIANLNEAKAAAEAVYAQAESTLKQAQAALINAQAETEKVRAEILKVQVKIQEVKLEEEKVELQKQQAQLEVLLARAEADKQYWANVLEDLIAQAEINAIENTQAILQAEKDFQDWVYTQAEIDADKALEAADKYYGALAEIQALKFEELETKALQALAENGAIAVKKAIHYQMEQIDKAIAEKEAIVAALKERQYMSTEEAKAAMKEAWDNLNDAYTAYMEALNAQDAADDVRWNVWNKNAEFMDNWYVFQNYFYNNFPMQGNWYTPEAWEEAGIAQTTYYNFVYDDEGNEVFLWNWEDNAWTGELYPGGEIYSNNDWYLDHRVIAPATIAYDNMATVINGEVGKFEKKMVKAAVNFEDQLANQVKTRNKIVANYNKTLAVHKTYVEGRADAVKKAETKFLNELDAKDEAIAKRDKAWADFRDYWLGKYDASRQLVYDRYNAQGAYDEQKKVSDAKKQALDDKVASIPGLKTAAENAAEAEAEAEGTYNVALAKAKKLDTDDVKGKLEAAIIKWNPKFVASTATKKEGKWVDGNKNVAGSSQATVLDQNVIVKEKNEALAAAEEELVRNPKGSAGYEKAKADYDAAEKALEDATDEYDKVVKQEGKDEKAYDTALADYDEIYGPVETAKKAWDDADKLKKSTAKAVADAEADTKAGGKTYDAWKTEDNKTKAAKTTLDNAEKALKDAIGVTKDATAEQKYEAYLAAVKEAGKAGTAWAELAKLYYGWSPDDAYAGSENWYDEDDAKFSWINSSFQLDYTATMLNAFGEEVLIGETLYPNDPWDMSETVWTVKWDGNIFYTTTHAEATGEEYYGCWNSLAYRVEYYQAFVDAADGMVDDAHDIITTEVQKRQAEADEMIAYINSYKDKEASYLEWTADRENADLMYNEVQKDTYDAWQVYSFAEAIYEATDAVANQKYYIYDPENDDADINGFVELTISEAIEAIEGNISQLYASVEGLGTVVGIIRNHDIEGAIQLLSEYDAKGNKSIFELKMVKKVLEETLKAGKVTLELVLETLDERVEWIDEQIQIYQLIADTYKTIMYGYLGIVEEDAVDGDEE